jgi:hypothetical protein
MALLNKKSIPQELIKDFKKHIFDKLKKKDETWQNGICLSIEDNGIEE